MQKPRRSLASRLVLLGFVQLVLLALVAAGVFVAEGPREEPRPDEHIDRAKLAELESLVGTPQALAEELDDLAGERVEVSIYSSAHVLIASNVDPPIAIPDRHRHDFPPPPPGPILPHAHHDHDHDHDDGPPPPFSGNHSMIVPIDVGNGERGILVARGVHRAPTLVGPLVTFVCGLVVLVIGALITARWIVRPIEKLSRTARALGTGDLQARSNLSRDDEIGELGARIDEMAERISSLMMSEKELLANVAHELRTPLARIGVALDLASEGDAEAARASLAEIHIDVAELGTIIEDILMAVRFELEDDGRPSSSLPLRRELIPASKIADAAADRMRQRHVSRPLKIEVAKELPNLDVDPRLFRRVIDNLLENAHKYTPDPDRVIDLTVSSTAGAVVFEVRDRGVGISAESLPRVFNAFFRGDRSRSRETGGVGLGLTLAKRLVEAHGGTITVDSKLNDGTTVRVTMPPAA